MVLRQSGAHDAERKSMATLPEQALQSERRRALKHWIFETVIRGPINGDLYTLATENHIGDWAVHGLIREGGKTKVLMLTDGYNCNIWLHEWESMVRSGQLRFTGRNHLWQ
jgi:hypothetical protein